MKIDTNSLDDGTLIQADFVLVGGGIVGMTLANQLADLGHDVAILESGGETPEDKTQDLYKGALSLEGPNVKRQQDGYLTASRFRYFGGSGNRWGGVSLPLDPADFEAREWVPNSGWPLTLDQLKPYYNRASDLLEIPRFFPEPDEGRFPQPSLTVNHQRVLRSRPVHVTRYTGNVPSGPFQKWKTETLGRERVRVYLGANVTRIALEGDGASVASLEVKTLQGKVLQARAKTYVLGTGGIENVRLLLASNDVHKTGIGNHSDWLGRAFQGHAVVVNGFSQMLPLVPSRAWREYVSRSRERVSFVMGTTLAAQKEANSANFSIYLRPVPVKPKNEQALHQVALSLSGQEAPGLQLLRALYGIEHTPNRDSRIVLQADSHDALGMPLVSVRWCHRQFDFDSCERSITQAARELGLHDIARLRWSRLESETDQYLQIGARHHMGATRMSTDPNQGVVNEHGRVHGVGNLYVGGSSVFPTSGLANPTLTILALTFRLGDHLHGRLGQSGQLGGVV